MANHCIKILDTFANAVYNGEKTFEIRENDRGYQRGDTVTFRVIPENIYHGLNSKVFGITYVLSGWGIKEGYVVFGIKEITDAG